MIFISRYSLFQKINFNQVSCSTKSPKKFGQVFRRTFLLYTFFKKCTNQKEKSDLFNLYLIYHRNFFKVKIFKTSLQIKIIKIDKEIMIIIIIINNGKRRRETYALSAECWIMRWSSSSISNVNEIASGSLFADFVLPMV